MTKDGFLGLLEGVNKGTNGNDWALCPAHTDKNPSLEVKVNKNGYIDPHCWAGCTKEAILGKLGLTNNDLNLNGHKAKAGHSTNNRKLVATFHYEIEKGKEAYAIERWNYDDGGKTFSVKHLENGIYVPGQGGHPSILYHLPEIPGWIAAGKDIYIPEGEAKADRLIALGFAATTAPYGANTPWKPEYNQMLSGARIIILPDKNDGIGRTFAQKKATNLHGFAESVKVLESPELKGNDIIDWLAAGLIAERLRELAAACPTWTPPAVIPDMKHFNLTPLKALYEEADEEIPYLWDRILIKGGLSVAVGKPKAGKSTWARNLAYLIAKGAPSFLGRAITASGPVVYFALEEKRSEVKDHFKRMGAAADLPIFIHTGSAPEKAMEELKKAIIESKAGLAIVDTLQRLIRVKDLNDYSQVSLTLELLMQIARDTGCHILLVHHANKGMSKEGGDSILGSTAIFGGVDTALFMRKGEEYRTICSEQRYGVNLPNIVLTLDITTGLTSSGGSLEDVQITACGKAIIEFIDGHEVTEKEIKDAITDYNSGIKSKSLRALCQGGNVRRQGLGKKGDPFTYSLTDKNAGYSGFTYIHKPSIPTIPKTDIQGRLASNVDEKLGTEFSEVAENTLIPDTHHFESRPLTADDDKPPDDDSSNDQSEDDPDDNPDRTQPTSVVINDVKPGPADGVNREAIIRHWNHAGCPADWQGPGTDNACLDDLLRDPNTPQYIIDLAVKWFIASGGEYSEFS